jgi:RND family efflux transporter MFP subunit
MCFPRALSFVLFTLLLCACGHEAPVDARLQTRLVRVAQVGNATAPERSYTGVISARVQSDLGFRIPGKITERLVDTGQLVKRGQPLMRIDRTDYALAILAQTGSVDAARARAVQTSADEARYRDLVSAGAISAITYDQSKAAADAAKAQLEAAEAQVKVSQNQAGYSTLLADDDGVVVQTLAEPGQVVAAGQTVVRLAHAGPREATINLPETLRPTIGSVSVATVFGTDKRGGAKLRQLSHAADPTTRTFEARYVLDESFAQVPLGTTVTIHVADQTSVNSVQIPLSAILDNGQGPGVWIIDPQASTVSWHRVTLGSVGEETVGVTSGLSPTDRFVSLGAHQLNQGEKVRIAALPGSAQ